MTRLYNRESQLYLYSLAGSQAQETDLSLMDFYFAVHGALPQKKDGKNFTEPLTATITIKKLSADTRDRITADGQGVELWTGYDGDLSVVFRGTIVNPLHRRNDGLDWVTTIYAKDAWGDFSNSFFSRSYPTSTPILMIVDDVARSFGLSVTNEFARADALLTGSVVFGKSKACLDKLARDYDFSWSISAETGVHITDNLNPPLINHTAVEVITEDTLLGAPSVEESVENEGKKGEQTVRRIHAVCILNPKIVAGSVVQFKAGLSCDADKVTTQQLKRINPNAFYIVDDYTHRGNSYGDKEHVTELVTREETI